jgi:hypothetical protein
MNEPTDAQPPPVMTCVKCAGQMELGLLVDATDGKQGSSTHGPERVLEWVRGTPERSWWNLKFKAAGMDRLQVATLRCTRCGFVELYAPQ